jgi:thiosulfate dehydrogenase (quinone) large subunit
MLAGSASTNPVLFAISVFLILGWKVAGYLGIDRVLIPALGTPWKPGRIFPHRSEGTALPPRPTVNPV